jgi:pyrroloquinoline-quinone synthase
MLSASLLVALGPFHLLKHPFYQAWMRGELSRAQLRNYAVQYYPHVLAFPRYISAVHSQCEDEKSRRDLAMNLSEEEGCAGVDAHPELWLRFCDSLGLNRDEVRSARQSAGSRNLCDGFSRLSRASYAEGLAALFAYEYQIPEIAKTKIEGLRQFYGIESEDGLKFFAVHEKADVLHSEACKDALDRMPEATREVADSSARESAALLWNFLSEAYAYA